MKIEKLSAWAEMISSVAVLATLVYLVIQTNQNAEAIKGATRQSMLATEVEFLNRSFNKPEIAGIQYKDELTVDERTMAANYVLIFMRIRENNWLQYKNGVLDAQTWHSYKSSIPYIVSSKNARAFWQNWAIDDGTFDPEFIEMINGIIAETKLETHNNYHDDLSGTPATTNGMSWITGCWQTEGGATRETWSAGAETHLFGHSVTTKDGEVVFFENLNLVKTDRGYTLSAYPMGKGPSDFPSTIVDEHSVTFQNTAHDYPQRISYTREGNRMTALISMADGSKPNVWNYEMCKD